MKSSRVTGLHRLAVKDRIATLSERGFLDSRSARALSRGEALLPRHVADRMIENVIGVFGLPFGIAPNFVVNEKEYLVPMVVEEPSIVAGASSAAKLVRNSDGFQATSMDPGLIGQVQIVGIEDPVVIDKILTHLDKKAALAEPVVLPQSRAPPQRNLFD